MKRALMIGVSAATAIAVSLPALVMAQGFPPPPPTLYYGAAPGATLGQGIVAIVVDGNSSTTCGYSEIVQGSDGVSGPAYAIDVITDAQSTGCGKAGRQVKFYLLPTTGSPGRLANEIFAWRDAGAPQRQDISLGASLSNRKFAPTTSRDGTW